MHKDDKSVAEVAAECGVNRRTIHAWIHSGVNGVILKSRREAGRRWIRSSDLAEFRAALGNSTANRRVGRRSKIERESLEERRRAFACRSKSS